MVSVSNPFVDYLSRYTTASPEHEAAFDEFIAQAPPPAGGRLRLVTRVETFLQACFQRPNPPSVILTGNAGDGKTYLCRQIIAAFSGAPVDDWERFAEQPIEHNGVRLHVVKDFSELGESQGAQVLRELAATLTDPTSPDRYLIAANEGRLRDLLGKADEPALYQTVDHQLQRGTSGGSSQLVVINLTAVTTSAFVPNTLRWMTQGEHWEACLACPILQRCPVRHNARRLRDPHVVGRVQLLYQLLEHLDIHVTVRDMLIHLAYTVTGDQRCHALQRMEADQRDLSGYAYYANIWGGKEGGAFRRRAGVTQHLDRLHVGNHSLFEIDNFIVSGAESDEHAAEHARLFAPAVDLNDRRFGQERIAYVEGGAATQADQEAAALMEWLPHCRRKLFFEWHDTERVDQLIAFRHLGSYLWLLNDERGVHDRILRELVLGLNRAFSRLFLTDADNLYVTAQYLHSAEQSRPLVRLTIPTSGIRLRVDRRPEHAFDHAWPDLYLEVGAPPALLHHDPTAVSRIQPWRLNLLLFEYLLRLAHGGTYNILAAECELSVRNLKDSLLSAFAREPAQNSTLEFFVAERQRYALKRLHIDEQNIISSKG